MKQWMEVRREGTITDNQPDKVECSAAVENTSRCVHRDEKCRASTQQGSTVPSKYQIKNITTTPRCDAEAASHAAG